MGMEPELRGKLHAIFGVPSVASVIPSVCRAGGWGGGLPVGGVVGGMVGVDSLESVNEAAPSVVRSWLA